MSKNKELPKELPPMDHSFELDERGQITGKQFKGTFKFTIPDLRAKAQAAVMVSKLNGGLPRGSIDPIIYDLHERIADLQYGLTEAPKWWKDAENGYTLRDYNVLVAVHDACKAYEDSWMLQVWGDEKEPEKEGSNDDAEKKGA